MAARIKGRETKGGGRGGAGPPGKLFPPESLLQGSPGHAADLRKLRVLFKREGLFCFRACRN